MEAKFRAKMPKDHYRFFPAIREHMKSVLLADLSFLPPCLSDMRESVVRYLWNEAMQKIHALVGSREHSDVFVRYLEEEYGTKLDMVVGALLDESHPLAGHTTTNVKEGQWSKTKGEINRKGGLMT